MKAFRNRLQPRTELANAMRAAALNIGDGAHRNIAARDADAIFVTRPERFRRGWGAMAAQGRSVMRLLPAMPVEERADAIAILRQCANVVEHGAVTVSETSLADARRQKRRA